MILGGIAQPACRLSGLNNPDLVGRPRARRGADNLHALRGVRESAETTAGRLVRGSPTCGAPKDFWSGAKTWKRPAAVRPAAEPQAEPSDVLSDRAAVLGADLVPHASKDESAQSAKLPPKSVEERIRGAAEVSSPPAPGFPLCAMVLRADCVALVSKEVAPVP